MNIDSAVVFRYISPLYDHPIVCDWAKIVSKIGRKFAAFCRSHCSKLASAAATKCGIMRVSPPSIFSSPERLGKWRFDCNTYAIL